MSPPDYLLAVTLNNLWKYLQVSGQDMEGQGWERADSRPERPDCFWPTLALMPVMPVLNRNLRQFDNNVGMEGERRSVRFLPRRRLHQIDRVDVDGESDFVGERQVGREFGEVFV